MKQIVTEVYTNLTVREKYRVKYYILKDKRSKRKTNESRHI